MDSRRYLDLFLAESREHLGAAYELQASLETRPAEPEALAGLLRHAHSLKGMASTLGVEPMAALAHALEELLERLPGNRAADVRGCLPLLRESLACLDRMLDRIEQGEDAGSVNASELVCSLHRLGSCASRPEPDPEPRRAAVDEPSSAPAQPDGQPRHWSVAISLSRDEEASAASTVSMLGRLARLGRVVQSAPPMLSPETGRFESPLRLVIASRLSREELEQGLRELLGPGSYHLAEEAWSSGSSDEQSVPACWVRVRADLLDDLVEELLGLRLEQARLKAEHPSIAPGARQRLQRCEFHLKRAYGTLMALRLVPFDSLARRLHQAVHALSAALGKDVHFEIVGGHVRVDRVVLDAMVDPLLHAVKNSLDHGLETAGERLASGKPPRGTLRLRLQRRADGVTIAIEDDGRGMHAGQLRRRAVALGLLDEAQSADLSDEQALMLTTLSGFTTARGINHVSGRGVGLDVVREAVESLGGALQIQSRPGCGTELLLSLPPGQALIQTLLVRCAGELYAVPLDAVQRVVDLRRENPFVARGIHDSEVPRPLRLDDHLGIAGHEQRPRRADRALVLSQGPPRLALVVDEVLGRRDVVVKALSTGLAGLQPYSGAALLADGTIALVLDAQALGAG